MMSVKDIVEREKISNYLVIKAIRLIYPNRIMTGRRLNFSEQEVELIKKKVLGFKVTKVGRKKKIKV
jgi:hypothetical protein